MRTHELIDQRSLALARAVAEKLQQQPELLAVARRNLESWIAAAQPQPLRAHLEWQRILQEKSLPVILECLRADTEEARRLRQSNPFAGLLNPQERLAILKAYETRAA